MAEKAKPIERNVVMTLGCTDCGSTSDYTLWEKNGQTWYSCSRKIGGAYCPGKPPNNAAPLDAPAVAPPPPAPSTPEVAPSSQSTATSGGSGYADLFRKVQDCYAELESLFGELAYRMEKKP